jgi:Icc-related predicted phosphoesterase
VLITHGPPLGILDLHIGDRIEQCGCRSLLSRVLQVKPRYHCFGHIHNTGDSINSGLKCVSGYDTIFSNGAVVGLPKGEVVSNGNLLTV